jgi:uncharacterized protein (DUF885 family)
MQQMADLVDAFVRDYHAFHPHRAIWDGRHEHDGTAPDLSAAAIQQRMRALERWGERLRALAPAAQMTVAEAAVPAVPEAGASHLTPQAAHDLALVEYARAEELFRWRDWRPHVRNPGYYHGLLDLSIYVKRPYAPPAERLDALMRHLGAVPRVLETARQNLEPPLSRPALEQAIYAYRALADYYDGELRRAGAELAQGRALPPRFHATLTTAINAVGSFVGFLREQMAQPSGDFRMGAGLLTAMVRHGELVDLPLERLRALGQANLERNLARIEELAGRLALSPAQAFEMLDRAHWPEEQILATTTTIVDEARRSMERLELADIPSNTTCRVVATPAFMRSGAAFMDAPGPFERSGLPAYFYVTLPDPAWPKSLRETWLAKLNPWGLRNTVAHEAYPGHLLHFLRLAQVPSIAARAFTSYACIEGWAHYAEQVFVEVGDGANDPRAELTQLGMALLRDCRYLVALDLHAGDTTLAQATAFFAAHTFLAPMRCRQEALRGAQDPGYLYYSLGKLMLLKLRDDYQRQEGQRYTLRRFHEAFLGCGAPPIPLARRLLLRAPAGDPL